MFAALAFNAMLSFWTPAVMTAGLATAVSPAPASSVKAVEPAPLLTPQFHRYGVKDGLPVGAVYQMTQDHHGWMWFATFAGLVRYDGVSFTLTRHVIGDPKSLPAGGSYAIFASRDDRIWVGGISGGLVAYDQRSQTFEHWEHDPVVAKSLADNEVWGISQTPDGAIWVATSGGLDRLSAGGKGFEHVHLPGTSGASPVVRALRAEADGRLWIGTSAGLFVRRPDGSIRAVPVDPAFHGDANLVWHIDGAGNDVRVAVQGGLLHVGSDRVARPLLPGLLLPRRVLSSTRDSDGRLWIGTDVGLLLDSGHGKVLSIEGHPLLPAGLPGNKLWMTKLDHQGGLWITFDESSVAYLPPGWDRVTNYTHVPDSPGSLANTAVSTVSLGSDGQLLVGGESGWVDSLELATGGVQHLVPSTHGQVTGLVQQPKGKLWIQVSGGLKLFDHGHLHDVDLSHSSMSRPVLLIPGPQHSLYAASWDEGVFRIDADTEAVTPVSMLPDVAGVKLPAQLDLHQGRLWYGSTAGLLVSNGALEKLDFLPGVRRGSVDAFAFDKDGFWLAMEGRLEHYIYDGGAAQRDVSVDFTRLFATRLVTLRVDPQNRLWLFASPGLSEFDRNSMHFRSFGVAQGLSSNEFSTADTVMTAGGNIVAPTNDGVVAFQPNALLQPLQHKAPSPLVVADVSVRRAGAIETLALDKGPLQLDWRDRDLSVDMRLASYINSAVNHYRFQLKGFDSSWVDVNARGERDFAGLPAGDYLLNVRAEGADGVWSRLAAPLHIHVEAPPWKRWWAWTAYALIVLLAVGWIVRESRSRLAQRHRMQLMDQQRQMAEAASAAKTRFLAMLSHEIRTPMTGVMGMAELLLSTPLNVLQREYTQAMQRSGSMLLKLLNDALDLARIEAGRLELELAPFDLRQLVEDVAHLEQGLAYAKGLRFVLDVADDLPQQLIGDAVRIKQVLLNLANNALKFTERGHVTLRAHRGSNGLVLSVIDSGPGIPEASQSRLFQRFEQEESPQRRSGSGLGLAICRELVDMMDGSIELQSRMGHGSTFHVRLPLAEPAVPVAPPTRIAMTGHYRLLLVEDDPIVAAVISGLLARQGHSVSHVVNGLAALAEIANNTFDVVLLDLDLPGVDGFQIARLLRQREPGELRMPIIAVTARSEKGDEAMAHAAGMDGVLHKPVSGEELAQALTQVLQVRRGDTVDSEAEPAAS